MRFTNWKSRLSLTELCPSHICNPSLTDGVVGAYVQFDLNQNSRQIYSGTSCVVPNLHCQIEITAWRAWHCEEECEQNHHDVWESLRKLRHSLRTSKTSNLAGIHLSISHAYWYAHTQARTNICNCTYIQKLINVHTCSHKTSLFIFHMWLTVEFCF